MNNIIRMIEGKNYRNLRKLIKAWNKTLSIYKKDYLPYVVEDLVLNSAIFLNYKDNEHRVQNCAWHEIERLIKLSIKELLFYLGLESASKQQVLQEVGMFFQRSEKSILADINKRGRYFFGKSHNDLILLDSMDSEVFIFVKNLINKFEYDDNDLDKVELL